MKNHRGRIPYGYEIRHGRARIEPEEAGRLREFFTRFLDGATMAEAAREAGLPCSTGTLPNLFRRREYVGTAFYPAIITVEMQARLIGEWERRKTERQREVRRVRRGVKIYTAFSLIPGEGDGDLESIYRRIAPLE